MAVADGTRTPERHAHPARGGDSGRADVVYGAPGEAVMTITTGTDLKRGASPKAGAVERPR